MIEIVFAILMIQNGKVIEYVPTSGMADCLEIETYCYKTDWRRARRYLYAM